MTSESYPLEISVREAKRLLDATPQTTRLVDVREAFEVQLSQIAGGVHIPMQKIPEHVDQLSRDCHLLIYCHHGGRSLRVTQFLRARGFTNVSNVAGGIDAWSIEIDPTLPRY